MEKPTLKISLETVKAVICNCFKLKYAPVHETLGNLGINQDDIPDIRKSLRDNFGLDVRIVITDTIADITTRML